MLAARDSHQRYILAMQWLSRLHAFLQYDIQCPGSASASLAKHDWDASYAMLNKDGKEKVLEKVKRRTIYSCCTWLGSKDLRKLDDEFPKFPLVEGPWSSSSSCFCWQFWFYACFPAYCGLPCFSRSGSVNLVCLSHRPSPLHAAWCLNRQQSIQRYVADAHRNWCDQSPTGWPCKQCAPFWLC